MALTEQQMIDAIKRTNEALNSGDFDAAIELADPDIVYVRPGQLPELRGAEALRAWMEPDAFESQHTELTSFETAGRFVLTSQHTNARGAGSGIDLELDSLALWEFNEEGKVTRVHIFTPEEQQAARDALQDG
jgi:ketosteroid isomerase-like protein